MEMLGIVDEVLEIEDEGRVRERRERTKIDKDG